MGMATGTAAARYWRPKLWLLPAGVIAVLLNLLLFAAAAGLSRDRLFAVDMTDPVSVNLVTLKPVTPPPPPARQEIPKPKPRTRPDFTPELVRPSVAVPAAMAISVKINPDLFAGGPMRGDFIFNATDLDTPPMAIMRTKPPYPYKARQRNIKGSVEVKFLVGADGRISDVQVLNSQPAGLFDATVLKTVPKWKFRPGMLAGEAVPSWVVTVVEFNLSH